MQNSLIQEFPKSKDELIQIVPFTKRHLNKNYLSWLNDIEVVRYSEQRHKFHTLESCMDYYEHQIKSDNLFLAIELLGKEERHVGNMGIIINKPNNIVDLSIMIGDKSVWGTGVATRAWCMAIKVIFFNLNYRMITAGTMEKNNPMISLMKRSGMKIDCILPDRFIFEGRTVGLVTASLKRDNFKV